MQHLIVFSHLRWNFVYQRPQHLMSRFAKKYITYYIEEAISDGEEDGYYINKTEEDVHIVVPHLEVGISNASKNAERVQNILETLFEEQYITDYLFWYYTPMALEYTQGFEPELIVYDCMDELSAFKFAPAELQAKEKQLMSVADVVFTGGNSLYEAKKNAHSNVYCCPSSIDKQHFEAARQVQVEPKDQQQIPHPRLGFFGVIDERFDIELIRQLAIARPDWHLVLLGPVVKIDPASLPTEKNIHYLGSKTYKELPSYLSGWDIALIPFAINDSTRFISPTKTPEYLAAGRPVISTPITDVVNPYGKMGLVHIAESAEEFVEKATIELNKLDKSNWLRQVDEYLSHISWDETWSTMCRHIEHVLERENIHTI